MNFSNLKRAFSKISQSGWVDGRVLFVFGAGLFVIGMIMQTITYNDQFFLRIFSGNQAQKQELSIFQSSSSENTVSNPLPEPKPVEINLTVNESLHPSIPKGHVKTPSGTVSIYVSDSDTSESVARKLQEAGIIDDARSFNHILVSMGYDRRIQNGTHYLTKDMDKEIIAKHLIGLR